jgi:hypothetical protein
MEQFLLQGQISGGRFMEQDAKAIALAYQKAFELKDVDKCASYLHTKGQYRGPLSSFEDKDAFVKEMSKFMHITKSARTKKIFVDDTDVCLIWDYETTLPSVPVTPIAQWFKIDNGKIREMHLHFNAVPFVAAVQKGEMAEALKSKK